MRKTLFSLFCILALSSMSAQSIQTKNKNFDTELAQKLQADEYGMKTYVLILLKTGANESTDKELRNTSFKAHFTNMNEMAKQGKLIVAGPMYQNEKQYRGLFVFDVKTFDEAKECMKNDLAIQNGFLEPEYYQWYGSAALPLYLEAEDKIWQKKP